MEALTGSHCYVIAALLCVKALFSRTTSRVRALSVGDSLALQRRALDTASPVGSVPAFEFLED